jgi:hypothetical protein
MIADVLLRELDEDAEDGVLDLDIRVAEASASGVTADWTRSVYYSCSGQYTCSWTCSVYYGCG